MLGLVPLLDAPVMSVVTPATGVPAAISGEPNCGCRLVVELYCGSALTELVCGKTVSEAHKLRRDDLIAAVGGLPQASAHAAQLALDALAAVLNQIAAREKSAKPQGNVFR